MNISGNTIFIAGATSGIGRGFAERFAKAGNEVIVAGRRQHLVDEVAATHENIDGFVLDVTDPQSINDALITIKKRYPETNVLFAVAGIQLPENLHNGEFLPTAEATVTTNLLGPIRLIAGLSELLARKDDAAIITVTSGLAFVPLPTTPTYNATKAAIHSFTESLRVQLADTNVQVIELVPPAVRTTLMNQQDLESAMPLEDYLDEAMALFESQPDAEAIIVEGVKFLRYAEVNGNYDELLGSLSSYSAA